MLKKSREKIKKEIKDILENIENVAEKSKHLSSVATEYQKARDLYYKELNDEKNAKTMQHIMDVLNFVINDGSLNEMMSGTTGDGKPWSYPNLTTFDDKAFKLIENELKTKKSNKLIARYADFLWLAKRDYKKAKIAVDSYLKLIGEYEKNDLNNPDQHFGLDVLESFKRSFQLSKSIKYKYDVVLKELRRLLFGFNPLSSSNAKLTIDLVEIVLENRKDFKDSKFWQDLIALCEKKSEKLVSENKWYFSREYLLNIKKIEELVFGKKNNKWDILIAESYVAEADNHKEGKSFAELSFLINAIEEYSKLKNYKKVEELKRRYVESSKLVAFNEISTKVDISDIVKNSKNRAKKICKLKAEDIIKILVVSPNFFPTFDQIEKMADKSSKKFIFQSIFGRLVFDQNMNQPKKYSSDEEKRFASILEQFGFAMSIYRHEIEILIMTLVGKKAVNCKDLMLFFKKNSWFGKMYEVKDKKGEVILKTRKIIDLIEPGLRQYFKAINKSLEKKKIPHQEIMLATDSLVLKVEGIIREIYRLLGKPTFIIRNIKGGESITYEKDLNDFLNDDFLEALLGKDLILVMKYLLTESMGHNLRNNVGHCLIQIESYSLLNLHILFLIIIRLGNYKFEVVVNEKKE
ncbi:MAG: DUF4209 domain-containing protein [Parcubacteria group bacterium]|jgi:hypothetical protein